MIRSVFGKALVGTSALAAGAAVLASGALAGTQQNIGNGVYVCDGAAQAGPCTPDADDGGSRSSGGSGRSRGGYTDNDYARETRPQRGWRTAYIARAISPDGKKVGISRHPVGHFTADSAASDALGRCQYEARGPCKLVASLPHACSATVIGSDERRHVGFAPFRLPSIGGRVEAAEYAGGQAAKEAAQAVCRKNKGGNCGGFTDIGCSAVEPGY